MAGGEGKRFANLGKELLGELRSPRSFEVKTPKKRKKFTPRHFNRQMRRMRKDSGL